jgi:excisionase family DNA binding protein
MMELLTLDEVAERLRVSRRTVERELAAGHIRPIRIGRRRLVTVKELEAYVAAAFRAA